MISSVYNAINWITGTYMEESIQNELNEWQYDYIKKGIDAKIKYFIEKNNLKYHQFNLSKIALDKFLVSIRNILALNKKNFSIKSILEFIENETEIAYHGANKHLINYILSNGWETKNRIKQNNTLYGNGDYFSNTIEKSHQLGGNESIVIMTLIIKPNFSGKYNDVIKYFTDNPYCEKWNYIVDNTNAKNFSLGLYVVSDKMQFKKSFFAADINNCDCDSDFEIFE